MATDGEHLYPIASLKSTQLTVGMREVSEKRKRWQAREIRAVCRMKSEQAVRRAPAAFSSFASANRRAAFFLIASTASSIFDDYHD
jgi:hypothetical protein